MTLLAPSIQSADIFKIEEAVQMIEEVGADICVVCSALFGLENPRATLSTMKEITKKGKQS